jgi:hypothetical protein
MDLPLASLIDRPAREALSRAQAGTLPLLAPGLAGLGLVSFTTLAGAALGGQPALFEPMLRALVEALLLATPVLLVVTTFALPKLSPSTTLSALAISLGVAGIASALVVPLLAFLWLCADGSSGIEAGARLIQLVAAPSVFLVGICVMLSRTLSAFSNWGGERIAWVFGLLTFSVFLMRLAPHFARS